MGPTSFLYIYILPTNYKLLGFGLYNQGVSYNTNQRSEIYLSHLENLRVHQKTLQLLALSAIAPPRIHRPTCLKSHAQHFGIDSSSVLLLV